MNKDQFKEFDIQRSKEFVDCWSEYYGTDTTKVFKSNVVINYIEELNIGNRLTDQNIKRLLRWKDPRMLTEKILSGPKKGYMNERVMRVIEKLEIINGFRFGKMSEDDFRKETEKVFPSGIIWQVFLFHIARPFEYPIADQNVFRAFSLHNGKETSEDWDGYMNYREYFFEVSISAGIIASKPKGNEKDIKIVSNLKKVDDALFAFGVFLNTYTKKN